MLCILVMLVVLADGHGLVLVATVFLSLESLSLVSHLEASEWQLRKDASQPCIRSLGGLWLGLSSVVLLASSPSLLHKLLPVDCLRYPVLGCRVVQDRLVHEEVSISHTWHFLEEVDWVELQIVVRFVPAVASGLDKQFLVEGGDIDFDEVLDVFGISELLVVDRVALFVLLKQGFTANWRLDLVLVGLHNSADLASCHTVALHNVHLYFKLIFVTD